MDIVLLKTLYGVVSGIILYIITALIDYYSLRLILPLNADFILLMLYFILYFGYIPLMRVSKSYHSKHLVKGITVYYSVSFITWVVLYDALQITLP